MCVCFFFLLSIYILFRRLSIGQIGEVVGGYRSEASENLSNILEGSGRGDSKSSDSGK